MRAQESHATEWSSSAASSSHSARSVVLPNPAGADTSVSFDAAPRRRHSWSRGRVTKPVRSFGTYSLVAITGRAMASHPRCTTVSDGVPRPNREYGALSGRTSADRERSRRHHTKSSSQGPLDFPVRGKFLDDLLNHMVSLRPRACTASGIAAGFELSARRAQPCASRWWRERRKAGRRGRAGRRRECCPRRWRALRFPRW